MQTITFTNARATQELHLSEDECTVSGSWLCSISSIVQEHQYKKLHHIYFRVSLPHAELQIDQNGKLNQSHTAGLEINDIYIDS